MRARPALFPFRAVGIAAVEEIRHHQSDHGIAQELQGLVVAGASAGVLVGPAGMGERAVEELEVRETVAQPLLELPELVLARLPHRARSWTIIRPP